MAGALALAEWVARPRHLPERCSGGCRDIADLLFVYRNEPGSWSREILMDKNHTKRKSAACTPRSRPVTAAHLNQNEAGSAHFQQFGNYSVALSTPVTNLKIVLLMILRSRREIKSCVSVGKSSWKKCADIGQQLRCIVKPQRFDLFKSGLFWSKPNGGTVSPWPNSKTILTLTARIMTKSCTSLHTRTSDVRWLPPRECSHASGLSRPQAKLARLVSILRSLYFQGHVAGAVVIRKSSVAQKCWSTSASCRHA